MRKGRELSRRTGCRKRTDPRPVRSQALVKGKETPAVYSIMLNGGVGKKKREKTNDQEGQGGTCHARPATKRKSPCRRKKKLSRQRRKGKTCSLTCHKREKWMKTASGRPKERVPSSKSAGGGAPEKRGRGASSKASVMFVTRGIQREGEGGRRYSLRFIRSTEKRRGLG